MRRVENEDRMENGKPSGSEAGAEAWPCQHN